MYHALERSQADKKFGSENLKRKHFVDLKIDCSMDRVCYYLHLTKQKRCNVGQFALWWGYGFRSYLVLPWPSHLVFSWFSASAKNAYISTYPDTEATDDHREQLPARFPPLHPSDSHWHNLQPRAVAAVTRLVLGLCHIITLPTHHNYFYLQICPINCYLIPL